MKCYQIQDAFGIDSLKIVDLPQPQPGPGQVLLKMKAWSLNYRDLLVATGKYNPRMTLPLIPLSDGVGEVAAVGDGVTRVKVGDRVAGIFMQSWINGGITEEKGKSALGGGGTGMLAEYVVLNQDGVVHVSKHLSDEEAATLPCAAVTAWHALVVGGGVKAGDSVLVMGTGGVSLFALQFATMHGARVIATSSSDEKLQRVQKLDAHDVINYRKNPEWGKVVRELTSIGVDHVVEVGGAGTMDQSLRAVRMGGYIALIGVLSGTGTINPMPILMRNVRVQGIYVGSRSMFEAMNRAIELHQMKPVVDKVFAFADVPEALRYMESGAHFGKICVRAE